MRIPELTVLSMFGLILCSYAGDDAVVEGRVKLPRSKAIAPVKVQRYSVVSKGGVVAMTPAVAVVYLEGKFPRPASAPRAQMVQQNLEFVDPLLAVRVGIIVEFPNRDDTYHNIFSYSKAKRFDLGRYLPTQRPIPSQVFDKAGMVRLHCEIHEHMSAIILVLDTPYFTKTDATGGFRLAGLPPGKYQLKAWVNSKKTLGIPVTLEPGKTLKVDLP